MEAYNYPLDTPVTAKITSLLTGNTPGQRDHSPLQCRIWKCEDTSKTAERSPHFFILLMKPDCK